MKKETKQCCCRETVRCCCKFRYTVFRNYRQISTDQPAHSRFLFSEMHCINLHFTYLLTAASVACVRNYRLASHLLESESVTQALIVIMHTTWYESSSDNNNNNNNYNTTSTATSSSMTWSTVPLDVQTSPQQRSQLGWSARMARGQTVSL